MTSEHRVPRVHPSIAGTISGKVRRQMKCVFGMAKLKRFVVVLLVITSGFLLIAAVTKRTGSDLQPVPVRSQPSWNQSGSVNFSPGTERQPHLLDSLTGERDQPQDKPHLLDSLTGERDQPQDKPHLLDSLTGERDQPQDDDFCNSESFRTYVKNKHGNYSSVAEYLSSVKNYLLAFRSPMILEEPIFYSWPESASEKEQRQSSSRRKLIVWYNPPDRLDLEKANSFGHCPVKDCTVSLKYKKDHAKADAVVFHQVPYFDKPVHRDHANQIFIYMSMESPVHSRTDNGKTEWNKAFNWTWNFRTDSDIFQPVAFLKRESSVPSHSALHRMLREKKAYVTWMSSTCPVTSKRDAYVRKMRKVIPVDIYGLCGSLSCPRHHPSCDRLVNNSFFYLSFENSLCVDYVTEKFYKTFFSNTYMLPVVRGGANYSRYFPEGTYVNADDFSSAEELGRYLLWLVREETTYVDMLWRKAHFVFHERGNNEGQCQLCYKVHYWQRFPRTYTDLYGWYQKNGCTPPKPF